MATIDTDPGFDTLAYAQTLKAAGVEDRQARLATKADLDNLEARLRAGMRGDLSRALRIRAAAIAGIVVAIVELV